MVDLAFLAKALAQSEQAAQQSNPYATASSVVDQINWNPQDFSTGENLAGGAVKGLLGGLFGGLGTNYVAGQKAKSMDLLGSLARGQEIARPDDMDLSVFAPLEQAGGLFALQQELENEQLNKQSSVKQAEAITSELAKRGVFLTPEGKKLELFNPLQEKAEEAAAIEAAKIRGANEAWGGDVGANPDSPQFKVSKEKNEALTTLRKEFNALDPVKNFAKASQAAEALAGALKDKNSVADQELVRYGILMIEPGMAVREGEQGAIAGSQSIPAEWKGELAKALDGSSKLNDNVRTGLRNLASRAYNSHKGLYDQAFSLYSKEAEFQGLPSDRLSYLGEPKKAEDIFGKIPETSASVPAGMKLQRNKKTGETRLAPQ